MKTKKEAINSILSIIDSAPSLLSHIKFDNNEIEMEKFKSQNISEMLNQKNEYKILSKGDLIIRFIDSVSSNYAHYINESLKFRNLISYPIPDKSLILNAIIKKTPSNLYKKNNDIIYLEKVLNELSLYKTRNIELANSTIFAFITNKFANELANKLNLNYEE